MRVSLSQKIGLACFLVIGAAISLGILHHVETMESSFHPHGMVSIQPGTFTMGTPVPNRSTDETAHKVHLSRGFLMGATEVTQGQWLALMGTNPSQFSSCGPTCPVDSVTWYAAIEFCNRLSRREGLEPAYNTTQSGVIWNRDAAGYRLPTEAEWEYAAQAGRGHQLLTTDQSRAIAWILENSSDTTHPVALKKPNAWGLYDMFGNVLEWMWDWYGPYPSGEARDPTGPSTGTRRARRGCSWFTAGQGIRSSVRYNDWPDGRCNHVGLRLVRTVRASP